MSFGTVSVTMTFTPAANATATAKAIMTVANTIPVIGMEVGPPDIV